MAVQLNFINRSNDSGNAQVVIFQKNVAVNLDDTAVAWRVIQHSGAGAPHPFTFPLSMAVSASDSWGNATPQIAAAHGSLHHVALTPSGVALSPCGQASSSREVQLRNDLPAGAVNAGIYKDGRLLALKTQLAPGQKAVFGFKPSIWIGVVPQVEAGDVLDAAMLSGVNTELSLQGIASADIVMTGGGPGKDATPFSFTLQNIQMA